MVGTPFFQFELGFSCLVPLAAFDEKSSMILCWLTFKTNTILLAARSRANVKLDFVQFVDTMLGSNCRSYLNENKLLNVNRNI